MWNVFFIAVSCSKNCRLKSIDSQAGPVSEENDSGLFLKVLMVTLQGWSEGIFKLKK